jgi:hypothetical protein
MLRPCFLQAKFPVYTYLYFTNNTYCTKKLDYARNTC